MKISIFVLALLFSGCLNTWKNPNTEIPATEISITSLLLAPAIYQHEGIKTVGKIWDLEYLSDNDYEIKFKLADKDGHYIKVLSESELNVGEGDIIEVTGYFFREFIKNENRFETYIIAKKVDLIKNSTM